MPKDSAKAFVHSFVLFFIVITLAVPHGVHAQRERQVEPPPVDGDYGTKFFDQLRSLFGRFRDADLQRAFQQAQPIQCAELVNDKGEWRAVAFFNEDRKLGDWNRNSIEEVKSDLSVYIFKGACRAEQDSVQLVTKFPVEASTDAYSAGKIDFDEIDVNVNAPVTASFDLRSQAYTFELPYLYVVRGRVGVNAVYSLVASRLSDRYATDVTNQWQCKSVRANDVTYRFLICQTATLPRSVAARSQSRPGFGASAYFILSDGKEASTSVKLTFGGLAEGDRPYTPPVVAAAASAAEIAKEADAEPLGGWQVPDSASKIARLDQGELRIRFNGQTWTNKIGSPQVLLDQKMSSLESVKTTPTGADYCVWRPASATQAPRVLANEPDSDVAYTMTAADKEKLTPVSIAFDMKSFNGLRLGSLQCFFVRAETAEAILFDRWVSIVGGHLTLEIRP